LTIPLSIFFAYHTVLLLGFTIGPGPGGGTVGVLLMPLVGGVYLALSTSGVLILLRKQGGGTTPETEVVASVVPV